MARTRTQLDGCGIAHASELLGQRWTLLVVRELLLGPKRFTDLRSGIPDISPNVLGQRLRELGESGIVRRRKLAPPAAVQVYELTEWGRDLEPAVLALGSWANRSPSFPRGAEMGPDSLVLALKSTLDPARAEGLEATYELRLGEIPFKISVKEGEFQAARGEAESPDATMIADPNAIAGVVFGGKPLGKAVEAGDIAIDGSRRAVNALFRALT
ncbi:MAG TPA: winged helix-turn-helix transcriptional regulator [Solirubrobacterales bacterium]|nr:winged helix-turn-helix transcriptional regulator [Solirubrobacterales bacterium]